MGLAWELMTYSKQEANPGIVSGIFNDGRNSTIIVLLDTFYGAAAGAVVATSVMLVANEPLVQGLQYGAGAGAIAGFGFGLFDTFVLADRSTTLTFMNPTWYEIPTKMRNLAIKTTTWNRFR